MVSGLFFHRRAFLRRWFVAGVVLVLGATAFTAGLAGVILSAEGTGNSYGVLAVATAVWCFSMVGGCTSLWRLVQGYEVELQRVLEREVGAEAADVARRLQEESARQRRHDLANALTAIEGAAMVLDQEAESLSRQDRSDLTKVLESGTGRLRHLLSQEDADEAGRGRASVGDDPAS